MKKRVEPKRKFDRSVIEKLSKEELVRVVENLQSQVDVLEEKLAEANALKELALSEKYIPSSEKMNYLFPELEAIMMHAENKEEEKEVTVNMSIREKQRKKWFFTES